MGFEFKPKRPLPEEIRRLMSEQLAAIEKALRGRAAPEKRIHEARKRIKEIRALLRLVRGALGPHFAIENAWYRDAGRALAGARDAAALVESVVALRKRARAVDARRALGRVLRALRARAREDAVGEEGIANLLAQLPLAREQLPAWPDLRDRFATIGDGLERTFRDGRRALRLAAGGRSPEQFHELRKRVKDHWYHVRLLRKIWPEVLKPYAEVIEKLSDALGRHHDLIVLRRTLTEAPGDYGDEATLHATFAAIEAWRDRLEKESIAAARPVYSEKPSCWRARIRGYWRAHEG
jgi:CHAD domain-containing protein